MTRLPRWNGTPTREALPQCWFALLARFSAKVGVDELDARGPGIDSSGEPLGLQRGEEEGRDENDQRRSITATQAPVHSQPESAGGRVRRQGRQGSRSAPA